MAKLLSTTFDRFVDAAGEFGRLSDDRDYEAGNRVHGEVMAAMQELKVEEEHGVPTLRRLAQHPDEAVREWAATYLLPFDAETAVGVLEELAAGSRRSTAFSARMVLQEWRDGRLKWVNWP